MNQILKEQLQRLTEDKQLIEAVRTIFNERIEKEKPKVGEEDNQKLGEKYRAYITAKELLEQAMVDIDSYRDRGKGTEKFNKGK